MIERHGKPVAALVSTEDLARLEEDSSKSVEESYRKALEEAGIEVTYPNPGKRVPRTRHLIADRGGSCNFSKKARIMIFTSAALAWWRWSLLFLGGRQPEGCNPEKLPPR